LPTIYSPAQAVHAGFLDETVGPDELQDRVLTRTAELASGLHRGGFVATRANARGKFIEMVREELAADLATFTVSSN